ncbi:hypothetical protein J6590_096757, partial [Homalodisca vitripennis]
SMADSSREIPRLDTILRRSALLIPGSMAGSSREIPRMDTILRRSALLIPGSMADSSREIPRMDTILRRSALLVPGSMADSSREIPRLDTIHRRSALLVPGSMADSSREIPRLDTIHRRSALLVPGSMADSSREIPRLDTILRRSALLVPGSMADSSREIPRLDTIHRRSALLVPGSIADSSHEIPRLVTIHRRTALLVPGSMADRSDEIDREHYSQKVEQTLASRVRETRNTQPDYNKVNKLARPVRNDKAPDLLGAIQLNPHDSSMRVLRTVKSTHTGFHYIKHCIEMTSKNEILFISPNFSEQWRNDPSQHEVLKVFENPTGCETTNLNTWCDNQIIGPQLPPPPNPRIKCAKLLLVVGLKYLAYASGSRTREDMMQRIRAAVQLIMEKSSKGL